MARARHSGLRSYRSAAEQLAVRQGVAIADFSDRAHPGKDRSHIASQRQCSQRTREQKRNPKAVLHERGATRHRYQCYLWAKKVRDSSLLGQREHALGKPRDDLRIPSLEATHEFSGTQREWRLSTRRVDVASAELKPRQQ